MAAWSRAAILLACAAAVSCATPQMPIEEQHASGHFFTHTRSPLGTFWSAGAVIPGDPMRVPPATEIYVSFRPFSEFDPDEWSYSQSPEGNLAGTIHVALNVGFSTCTGEQAPPVDVTLFLIDAGEGFSAIERGLRRQGTPWRIPLVFVSNSEQLLAKVVRTTAHETFHRWAVGRPAFRNVSTIEEEVAAYVVGYCAAVVTTGELPIEAHPPSMLAFGQEGSPGDRAPFSDETLTRLSRAYRSGERFDPPTTAAIYLGLVETLLADLTASGPSGIREALPALARQIAGDPASLWDVVDALAADGIDAPDAADAP